MDLGFFGQNPIEIVGHSSYLLIFTSFMMRSVLAIRLFSIVASSAAIYFNLYAKTDPIWLPIQWNCVFITINIFHIGLILWEKRKVELKGHHSEIHQIFFNDLTPGEYLSLASFGQMRTSHYDEVLIPENDYTPMLMILFRGKVKLNCKGEELFQVSKKQFVGEMSFLTGEQTKAEVQAIGSIKYFMWPKEKLKDFLLKHPKHMSSVQRAIGSQFINQILLEKQKRSDLKTA